MTLVETFYLIHAGENDSVTLTVTRRLVASLMHINVNLNISPPGIWKGT